MAYEDFVPDLDTDAYEGVALDLVARRDDRVAPGLDEGPDARLVADRLVPQLSRTSTIGLGP
jgi:hypothetical protein